MEKKIKLTKEAFEKAMIGAARMLKVKNIEKDGDSIIFTTNLGNEQKIGIKVDENYKVYMNSDVSVEMFYSSLSECLTAGRLKLATKFDLATFEDVFAAMVENETGKPAKVLCQLNGQKFWGLCVEAEGERGFLDLEKGYREYLSTEDLSIEWFFQKADKKQEREPEVDEDKVNIVEKTMEELTREIFDKLDVKIMKASEVPDGTICRKIEDLALVPVLEEEPCNLCLSEEDADFIINLALRVSQKKHDLTLKDSKEIIRETLKNNPALKENPLIGIVEMMLEKDMGPKTYSASADYRYGAAALFYEGGLERAYEKVGGDFIAVTTSIGEWMLTPYNTEQDLKIVKTSQEDPLGLFNLTEGSNELSLTDSVYVYTKEGGFRKV